VGTLPDHFDTKLFLPAILDYGFIGTVFGEDVAPRRVLDRGRVVDDIGSGMKPNKVRLFVKPFCGWCHEAEDWLEERGIEYEKLDVISDRAARQEMLELSGQTLAPVIDVDGEILADFDTDQLEEFWKRLEKSAA
jgi:glutaredoxin